MSKEKAAVDRWLKDLAPSTELRKWFGHEPERWPEFKRRYQLELGKHAGALNEIRSRGRKGAITLLFAAKDKAHNNAVALLEYLGK